MIGFFYAMKVCSKCKIEKEFIEFCKNKTRSDGYHSVCKVCKKKYDFDNKEIKRSQDKLYRIHNKEKIKLKWIKWLENNKDKRREYDKQYNKKYRLENLDKIKKQNKKYSLENKKAINIYFKNKKNTDPLFKLKCNIRNLIGISIKRTGYSKTSKTYEILGCSYEEFKIHLENQFTEGMTWENQGKWHMDHIYPVSLATDEEHLIKLNHYTNYQPLWAVDNLKKGNKI